MHLQVTSRNLNTMFEEANVQLQQHSEGCQRLYGVQLPFGEVELKRTCLRAGMEISEYGGTLRKDLSIACETMYPHLEISHTFSGQGNWSAANSRDCELSSGISTLVYMRDRKINAELLAGQGLSHMELRIDLRYFPALADELMLITSSSTWFSHQIISQPRLDQLFQQLQQCTYTDSLRRLYLEGKCYELLACYLAETGVGQAEQRTSTALSASDIEALQQARHILQHCWISPPSLLELARMVSINDYKLKAGFKELYGTTVFGYVRSLKMNAARQLLESGQANVSSAAASVGYSNLSHFAAAYRKMFGYNPSQCVRERQSLQIGSKPNHN